MEFIVNIDPSRPSCLTRGKGNSPGRLRRFPRRLARCSCSVFVLDREEGGWKRASRGRGSERSYRDRLFFFPFISLFPSSLRPRASLESSFAFCRVPIYVFVYGLRTRCTNSARRLCIVKNAAWLSAPGIRPVIRGDVGGEYFHIIRHFRLDVARFVWCIREHLS